MVLVTRSDLKLSRGKLAAQCGHAVAECVLKAKREEPRMLKRYMRDGARKIVCETSDLESLGGCLEMPAFVDWCATW